MDQVSERPWSKFFWSDWDSDEGLRQCSLAAQGLWMRMLCICAKGEPRGYLTIRGVPLDVEGMSRSVGRPESEIAPLMEELDHWGVFSRDRKGRIYSRRIIRDEKRSNEGKKHIKKRWGQDAENKEETARPNRQPNSVPSPHIPEARSQKRKTGSNEPFDADFERLWAAWQAYKTPKGSKRAASAEFDRHVRKAGLDPGMVIAQAQAYCEECRRTDTNTQHIERWIKKHRWEDERIEFTEDRKRHPSESYVAGWAAAARDG